MWDRWLALDPVRMVPHHAETMRSMRAIYIDAGKKDEFYLDLGAEAFRRALEAIGVTDVSFDLFDGTTCRSSTGTRAPWPTWRSGSRPDRGGQAGRRPENL